MDKLGVSEAIKVLNDTDSNKIACMTVVMILYNGEHL